jgi:threonine/homoserine/homoserine lactone efflux protein
MLTAIAAFSVAAALLVVLPGPDTMVVVRGMVRGGRRRALWTAAGGLTGLLIWVAVTALGLAALLRASHEAYLALKILGACYLVWLGIQSLRSRGEAKVSATVDERPASGRVGGLGGYGAGLATNLLNPKIGVLFVAMLPGFVPAGQSVGTGSLMLGAVYIIETALYLGVLIALSGPVLRWMSDGRIRRRVDRMVGVVFVGFGMQLVTKP